ncbi:MAG: hypothetical protein SFU91_07845 [Chloroherpetonaceae bacterium]|nr:hypothetical protein [Chloroherpetonaceae bacterium]
MNKKKLEASFRLTFSLLIIAISGISMSSCNREPNYEDFMRSVDQINDKQRDIFERSQEVSKMIREVNRRHPEKQITFDSTLGLSDEQQSVILELIRSEQDASFKGVLQKLIDTRKEVVGLQEEIQKIKDKLPTPYLVKRGDSHRSICLEYLKNAHNISGKEAEKLIDKVALVDEMVPGFNIWLYYNDGVFGTFVTQGDAKVNPNRLRYSMRRDREQRAYERGKAEADSLKATSPTDSLTVQQ